MHELVRVLGREPRAPAAAAPRASGTLASHYAPRTPARLIAPQALMGDIAAKDHRPAVLARTLAAPPRFGGRWIRASSAPEAYAHDLYANLRTLDAVGAVEILIEAVPVDSAWLAIGDRLARAVHGDDDDRD